MSKSFREPHVPKLHCLDDKEEMLTATCELVHAYAEECRQGEDNPWHFHMLWDHVFSDDELASRKGLALETIKATNEAYAFGLGECDVVTNFLNARSQYDKCMVEYEARENIIAFGGLHLFQLLDLDVDEAPIHDCAICRKD